MQRQQQRHSVVYDRDRLQQGGGAEAPNLSERAYVSICFPANKRVQKTKEEEPYDDRDLDRWTSIPK